MARREAMRRPFEGVQLRNRAKLTLRANARIIPRLFEPHPLAKFRAGLHVVRLVADAQGPNGWRSNRCQSTPSRMLFYPALRDRPPHEI